MTDKEQLLEDLWKRYLKTRSVEDKNELLLQYVHLVKRIVLRLMPTRGDFNEFDDLVSCGVLGLMDAIEKFDISREVKFETYAAKRIRGEIIDHMRKLDWASASLRRKITRINEVYAELEHQLGRHVTDDEVAQHMEMNVDDLRATLEKSYMFNLVYFEDSLSDGHSVYDVVQSEEDTPEISMEKNELKSILAQAIDTLMENERLVITLYYFEELMLKEIAAILGVTESRVSQIHSKVLLKLKDRLQQAMA